VERDPRAAALWYLHDASSIPYALDLTGYAFLAFAAILVASTMSRRGGRPRATAWCLVLMAVLSLAALGFHAGGLATFVSIATIASGVFTLPVLVLAMLEGRGLRRAAEGPADPPRLAHVCARAGPRSSGGGPGHGVP
jgi:hypothetical protein